MTHEPRLTRELRTLLNTRRVAALGTIDHAGAPFVSMVPFAIEPQLHCLVIHVSGLAAHTRNLQARNRVSLLVMQSEVAGFGTARSLDEDEIRVALRPSEQSMRHKA